jgi:hypothetical protein
MRTSQPKNNATDSTSKGESRAAAINNEIKIGFLRVSLIRKSHDKFVVWMNVIDGDSCRQRVKRSWYKFQVAITKFRSILSFTCAQTKNFTTTILIKIN